MISYGVHFLMNIATVTIDGQISQLEIEVQGIPASIHGQYTTWLRQAKNELIRYRKIHKESFATVAPADFVPGTKGSGSVGTSNDPFGERTRLLAGAEILEDGSRRIVNSTRIAFETETYGANILKGLRGQREQIENARDTVSCHSFLSVAYAITNISCELQIQMLTGHMGKFRL